MTKRTPIPCRKQVVEIVSVIIDELFDAIFEWITQKEQTKKLHSQINKKITQLMFETMHQRFVVDTIVFNSLTVRCHRIQYALKSQITVRSFFFSKNIQNFVRIGNRPSSLLIDKKNKLTQFDITFNSI